MDHISVMTYLSRRRQRLKLHEFVLWDRNLQELQKCGVSILTCSSLHTPLLGESEAWSAGFSRWGRICSSDTGAVWHLMLLYLLGLAFSAAFSLEHSKVFPFFLLHPAWRAAFSALLQYKGKVMTLVFPMWK